jgi:protein transport protein SEC24
VVESTTTFYESSSEGEATAAYEFDDEELQDASEYGYGFWMRYMSEFPKPYTMPKNKYHFISRMTSNKEYQDFSKYGDRTLAIFLVGIQLKIKI